jgi:hypothetical protein
LSKIEYNGNDIVPSKAFLDALSSREIVVPIDRLVNSSVVKYIEKLKKKFPKFKISIE